MATVDNTPASQFDTTVMQLRELMDNRGLAGIAMIQQQFGNVLGICTALRVTPNEGMSNPFPHLIHEHYINN